jgi:hypothetical protein
MAPEENPEDVSKPILGPGTDGHYWVKLFLSASFPANRQVIPHSVGPHPNAAGHDDSKSPSVLED